MAIVIMVVSCIPCQDISLSFKKNSKTPTTIVKTNDNDHGGIADDCSPLCACSCCSAYSCPQSFIITTINTPEIALTHSSFYNSSLISISLPVWQPPQLLAWL
ncbi:MAG: hypothetical protein QM731_08735 [Chitinophagaceae bacterium]